jgi:putative FmdB family regulatory protein
MPTYEYRCPKGHEFEKFYQRITSHPSAVCPKCGKRAKRLISGGAGLVFKGSGFYITDYKRSGEKKDGEKHGGEKHDAKSHDHKSATKSDRKSDKKDASDK